MNNLALVLAKLALLASGAAIGAVLARLVDAAMVKSAEERSMHDKNRYAQGLSPIQPGKPKE